MNNALFSGLKKSLPWIAGAGLLLYWGFLLGHGPWRHLDEQLPDIGGLARYLLGIVVLLALVWLTAHLNYRWTFRRWLTRPPTRPYYWAWLCVLAWLLFELLQFRTGREPDFADENLLVTAMLIGFIVTYSYLADSFRTRRESLQLLQQQAEAELTTLRAQLNPHFLFNALNTIFNEAQRSGSDALADHVQQLSGLLRFTLTDAREPLTTIEAELSFLEKYIALQRARIPDDGSVRLQTRLDWDGQPASIAPLLLIPLVENAFQYGLSMNEPSWITLDIDVEDQHLRMHLANSLFINARLKKGLGTGIDNVRRRLTLLYPDCHRLQISQTRDSFVVLLTIDL